MGGSRDVESLISRVDMSLKFCELGNGHHRIRLGEKSNDMGSGHREATALSKLPSPSGASPSNNAMLLSPYCVYATVFIAIAALQPTRLMLQD
jgi:hypothetical protein